MITCTNLLPFSRSPTKESGMSLTEFVENRFRLYDDHQKGVPEPVQIWQTINHIKGDLKQKLCYNRDTTRTSFLERCRLIENAGDDDETDYTEDESDTLAVRNGSRSPVVESNEQSNASAMDRTSTPTYAASEHSTDDQAQVNERTAEEEEEEEEEREVILIEDSDEEIDENHINVMRSIKREFSQTMLGNQSVPAKKKRV